MGFERVAGIFATHEGFTDFSAEPSNYDCRRLRPALRRNRRALGQDLRGAPSRPNAAGLTEQEQTDVAFRVLADHARCVSCAIADGILPGNEGRNYVIRRILRRAALYGRKLGLASGFFEKLVGPVVAVPRRRLPRARRQEATLRRVIKSEEESFGRTLERGLRRFDDAAAAGTLPGPAAFELYDTYGFPLDLTQLIAQERGLTVDVAGFEALMEQQRERGRAAQKKEVIVAATDGSAAERPGPDGLHRLLPRSVGGYPRGPGRCRPAPKAAYSSSSTGRPSTRRWAARSATPGTPSSAEARSPIVDTVKDKSGRHLHKVAPDAPVPAPGAAADLAVDLVRRRAIQRHHTATHLLHWALRKVLGHPRAPGGLAQCARIACALISPISRP